MLVANIEKEVRKILEKEGKGGWLRVAECAKKFAKGDASKETKFYRWRKQVEKRKVPGFQTVPLPKNVVFIGLDSADPRVIESFISEDKKFQRSAKTGFGFWERRRQKTLEEKRQKDKERRIRKAEADAFEEIMELEGLSNMSEYQEKEYEIQKKHLQRQMELHRLAYPEDDESEQKG